MRRYVWDAVVVLVTFGFCLLAWEAYNTWQRVNALWMIAVQNSQAQVSAQQRQALAQPTAVPDEKPRGK